MNNLLPDELKLLELIEADEQVVSNDDWKTDKSNLRKMRELLQRLSSLREECEALRDVIEQMQMACAPGARGHYPRNAASKVLELYFDKYCLIDKSGFSFQTSERHPSEKGGEMSYHCGIHGWRHLLNPCPSCQSTSVSTTANGPMFDLVKILQKENEALKAEAQRAESSERNLIQDCMKMSLELAKLKEENERLKVPLGFGVKDHACSTGDCPHEYQRDCDRELVKFRDERIASLELLAESYRAKLAEIQSEIDRGKTKDCLGCCNGNDIPEYEICRSCWRMWIDGQMYMVWDWKTTQKRIDDAGVVKEARQALEEK